MLFLTVESDWRAANLPPATTISPNTSNKNLEIATLFNLVELFRYYVFEDDTPPMPSGQGLQVMPRGIRKSDHSMYQ